MYGLDERAQRPVVAVAAARPSPGGAVNARALPRSPGFRKSNRDQRSPSRFSIRVPVRATRAHAA